MKRCDSCGKIITDTKEKMCPFCGAVSSKSVVCTHDEDRWNRNGDEYSFHGNDNKKSFGNSDISPEDNINKMFSFGSEIKKEKPLKAPVKKQTKRKKPHSGAAAVIIVLLIIFVFLNNLGLFEDNVINGWDDSYYSEEENSNCLYCWLKNVTATYDENGLLFYINETPCSLEEDYSGEDFYNMIADSEYITACVSEITAEDYKSGINYGDYATVKNKVVLDRFDDDIFGISAYGVMSDDTYILFTELNFHKGGETVIVRLDFDAVRIHNNEVSYFNFIKDDNGHLLFDPVSVNENE